MSPSSIGHEKPVTGLTAADFVVKEDGAPVEIKTFAEIQPTTPDDPDNIRSIVILLDDVGGSGGRHSGDADHRERVRAKRCARRRDLGRSGCTIATDEPFGDRGRAVAHRRFQAASFPFADVNTAPRRLTRVADLSRQLEAMTIAAR